MRSLGCPLLHVSGYDWPLFALIRVACGLLREWGWRRLARRGTECFSLNKVSLLAFQSQQRAVEYGFNPNLAGWSEGNRETVCRRMRRKNLAQASELVRAYLAGTDRSRPWARPLHNGGAM